jgi:hypothetical protein
VSRDIVITGSSSTIGTQASGIGGTITVSEYLGTLDLTRVVIKVLQPAPDQSPTISATLSVAEGESTSFTDSPTNRLQEATSVLASNALKNAISAAGGTIDEYARTKNSDTYADTSLTDDSPLNRPIDITQTAITIFDSQSGFGSFTSEELNAIFRDGGSLEFEYLATSTLNWNQTTTATITATLAGANTGQVIVEYYAVPEPSTTLLFGAGAMTVLFLRRRTRA